ncbi:unnamed protein product [Caenorhabditis sp. 36 PRJEB53466]|nr:unnamed protein product [Caenorhabditis sp. 36 PRJEB53466]
MARSLCCCGNRTKVADSSEEIIGKQQLKNVFVVCTQNVLTRALTGKLIGSLEDRHLIPVHMKLLRPTQELIDKSNLLKSERRRQLDDAWMLLIVRGREAQTRVSDCIRRFKAQYSLHKRDILWTDNEQQAKHEEGLWFKKEENESSTSNGEAAAESAEQNGVESSASSVKEEPISQLNSDISTEGPQLSISSSRILTPEPTHLPVARYEPPKEQHEEEIREEAEGPTAEVISNTAVILEPSPIPIPAPVIINQPTKIE